MTWFANIKMLLCRFIDKKDQRAAGNRLHGQPVRICGWQSRQRRELILSTDPLSSGGWILGGTGLCGHYSRLPKRRACDQKLCRKKRPHGRSTAFCPPPRRNRFRRVGFVLGWHARKVGELCTTQVRESIRRESIRRVRQATIFRFARMPLCPLSFTQIGQARHQLSRSCA